MMRSIAIQKKKENIAEYILFMWQVEDLLRGSNFDLERLNYTILEGIADEEERKASLKWLKDISEKMKNEAIEQSGHLPELNELITEILFVQNTLLTTINDVKFKGYYHEVQPLLKEFSKKSDGIPKSDVENCLNALYGVLLLRLQKKEISPETEEAIGLFSRYMAYLSAAYHKMKSGDLKFKNN